MVIIRDFGSECIHLRFVVIHWGIPGCAHMDRLHFTGCVVHKHTQKHRDTLHFYTRAAICSKGKSIAFVVREDQCPSKSKRQRLSCGLMLGQRLQHRDTAVPVFFVECRVFEWRVFVRCVVSCSLCHPCWKSTSKPQYPVKWSSPHFDGIDASVP